MRIVSLTSIPPRFATLGPVLSSLLAQGADAVVLALPRAYRRFPGPVAPPPLPDGVTLLWSDSDYGPATKLLPALRRFPNARIAACDDDCLYAPGWLDALSAAEPGVAATGAGWSVNRLKRHGATAPRVDIAQGYSGLLVAPGMFDDEVFTLPEPAYAADDIWLSGHLARHAVPLLEAPGARACVTPRDAPAPLQDARVAGLSRAEANAACARLLHENYGIWPALSAPSQARDRSDAPARRPGRGP